MKKIKFLAYLLLILLVTLVDLNSQELMITNQKNYTLQ